ncbi:hypothetical protein L6R52_44130, partial [Myxococcota bacterium]|nr:hypothetical protein [Myxococcota bacterium]
MSSNYGYGVTTAHRTWPRVLLALTLVAPITGRAAIASAEEPPQKKTFDPFSDDEEPRDDEGLEVTGAPGAAGSDRAADPSEGAAVAQDPSP